MLLNEVIKFIRFYMQNVFLADSIDTKRSNIQSANVCQYGKLNKFISIDIV